jgi:ornithine decarboxylase
VEWFVVDSADELRRVHEVKPDARLYLRIATPNIGSDWPLSGKFGAGAADAREIVALAARGASNAEIAERLVLSVRTVETHLFRAM